MPTINGQLVLKRPLLCPQAAAKGLPQDAHKQLSLLGGASLAHLTAGHERAAPNLTAERVN